MLACKKYQTLLFLKPLFLSSSVESAQMRQKILIEKENEKALFSGLFLVGSLSVICQK